MATIEERLKAIEEKLGIEQKPVAGWYFYKGRPEYLMFFNPDRDTVYGFNVKGEWVDECESTLPFNKKTQADPKEVEARLIEEAKRRGFKGGVKFVNLFNGARFKSHTGIFNLLNSGELVLDNNTIFNNSGEWAEIIPEPLTLNGKEVVVDDLGLDIGGVWFTTNNFKTYISQLEIIDVKSVRFRGVDAEFKVSDLKQLLTKIESRENK